MSELRLSSLCPLSLSSKCLLVYRLPSKCQSWDSNVKLHPACLWCSWLCFLLTHLILAPPVWTWVFIATYYFLETTENKQNHSPGLGRWFNGPKQVLCTHWDLNSSPIGSQMWMYAPITTTLWGAETGGLSGLAGWQHSWKFSEKPYLKGISWLCTLPNTWAPKAYRLHIYTASLPP